jgi:hypothetical protein
MDQANDPKKNKLLKYRKVARKLHKAFQNNSKRIIMSRGNVFNVDFTEDDTASNAKEVKERDRFYS